MNMIDYLARHGIHPIPYENLGRLQAKNDYFAYYILSDEEKMAFVNKEARSEVYGVMYVYPSSYGPGLEYQPQETFLENFMDKLYYMWIRFIQSGVCLPSS